MTVVVFSTSTSSVSSRLSATVLCVLVRLGEGVTSFRLTVREEAGEFPAELFDFVAVRGDKEAFESPDLDCRVVFFMIICEMALQGIRGPEHQSIQERASWSDRQFQHLQQRYPAANETQCI